MATQIIKKEKKMKKTLKTLMILILVVFLVGCSSAWREHDTVYKNNDHMFFSLFGYKNPTYDNLNTSQFEDWWGEEIEFEDDTHLSVDD